jgi:hypothetical protein
MFEIGNKAISRTCPKNVSVDFRGFEWVIYQLRFVLSFAHSGRGSMRCSRPIAPRNRVSQDTKITHKPHHQKQRDKEEVISHEENVRDELTRDYLNGAS